MTQGHDVVADRVKTRSRWGSAMPWHPIGRTTSVTRKKTARIVPDPHAAGSRETARLHRGRAVAVTLAVILAAVAAWFVARPAGGTSHGKAGRADRAAVLPAPHARAVPLTLAAAESELLPWHLPEPVSRAVMTTVSAPAGQLIVLGGLTQGGTSTDRVYAVPVTTGAARLVGTLTAPLHDAAIAVSAGRALVFGGGSSATVGTVQSFPLAGGGRAVRLGSLPAPRSDAQAVTIGALTYLIGGYDGSEPDAWVIATTDGRAYTRVAALPVPVRYPAVAALNGQIYAFGGQAVTGPHAGLPVNLIQAVDPARRTAGIVGHLPEPLAGAAAVTVAGELFVAGGEATAAAGSPSPTRTVSTIWAFDPVRRRLLVAGQLQVPVSHAAVAAAGSAAWIVGGESGGIQVSSVQVIRPARAFGIAGAPGAGSVRTRRRNIRAG
jgi:hypothetical protein